MWVCVCVACVCAVGPQYHRGMRRDCAVLLVESSNLRASLVDMIPEADVILELRRTGRFSGDGLGEQCEVRVLKQQMGPPCTILVQFWAASGGFRSHGG